MACTMTDKQFSSNNFYEVLGVDPNASQNEIKRMYQVLVLKVGNSCLLWGFFSTHLLSFSPNFSSSSSPAASYKIYCNESLK